MSVMKMATMAMMTMDWLALGALFGAIFPLVLMCIGYAYVQHRDRRRQDGEPPSDST